MDRHRTGPAGVSAGAGPLPPFHLYRSFLDEPEREALLQWTLSNQDRFEASRLGSGTLDPALRQSLSLRDLGPIAPVLEMRLRDLAEDMFARTGTRPFPIDYVEQVLIAYGDGAHFAAHTDMPVGPGRKPLGGDRTGRHERMLSAVYYFHCEPKAYSGGALRLHPFGSRGGGEGSVDVEPVQNGLLVFPAWAMHEVRPVSCPSGRFKDHRFAVNCWLCRATSG